MMKKLLTALFIIGMLTTTTLVNAGSQTASQEPKGLSIQIVKDHLELTQQSFKSTQVEKYSDGTYVVKVVLTPEAASKLNHLTANNINHEANIVWKRQILSIATIQSPISSNFLITGLNKQQAEIFVKELGSP